MRRVRLSLVFRLKGEPPYSVARGRRLKGVGVVRGVDGVGTGQWVDLGWLGLVWVGSITR